MRAGLRAGLLSLGFLLILVGEARGDEKEKAQAHYAEGLRAYNIGDFEVAIKEWTEGYRLHNAPEFLLNIAQAHRMTENYERALFFYSAYLRESPNAPNVEQVAALRDEMQRLVSEQEAAAEKEQTDSAAEPTTAAPVEDSTPEGGADMSVGISSKDPPEPSGLVLPGLIAAGAGVALVGTGAVFGILASSAESDLEKAARDGEPWTQGLENKESTGERNALISKICLGVGVAAIGTGAALYFIGSSSESEAARDSTALRLMPQADDESVGFSFGGAF